MRFRGDRRRTIVECREKAYPAGLIGDADGEDLYRNQGFGRALRRRPGRRNGAASTVDPAPSAPETIQGGRDINKRLTVPVTIDGGGTYQFVVDTGAERTVLSRELAERLTLAPAAPVTLLSIAGQDQVATAIVPGLRLTSSRSRMEAFEAPLLSEFHLGAVGMLGIDSLQTKRVVLDFRAMRMSISEAPRSTRVATDEIVVTARRRLGQLILVDAEAEGQKINVIIDTGSAVSIGNPALRERLERRKRLGPVVPISITSVTGGQTPPTTARSTRSASAASP
ncbi:retropepsin-like aspartic protease [Rhizorhabdus histidinilytica]